MARKHDHIDVRGNFSGENSNDDAAMIDPLESPDMRNVDLSADGGVLGLRMAREKLGLGTHPITGGWTDYATLSGTAYTIQGTRITGIFEFYLPGKGAHVLIAHDTGVDHFQKTGPLMTIDTPSPLSTGTGGAAFSDTVTASGGKSTYTWSLYQGDLPAGTSLSGSTTATETISGTLSYHAGSTTYTFVLKVVDSSNPAQAAYKKFVSIIAAGGTL